MAKPKDAKKFIITTDDLRLFYFWRTRCHALDQRCSCCPLKQIKGGTKRCHDLTKKLMDEIEDADYK